MRSVLSRFRGLRHRGFVGPKYSGVLGMARLAWQGFVGHVEVVSFAEPGWWVRPKSLNPAVTLVLATSVEEALPYVPAMERAYMRDFGGAWREAFGHGQQAAFALLDGALAAFIWIQDGERRARCHFMRLQPGEYRVFRAGVLPAYRSKGIHSTHYVLLLEALFARGARRVYVEAFEDNEYAWHAQRKAGFVEFGRIDVRRGRRGRTFVRWI
jgi:ribosomal protein S18 acetylase RimI-like enzyme